MRLLLRGFGIDTTATLSLSGTLTNGQPTVTGLDTTHLEPGMLVSGTGIPAYTSVLTVDVVDGAQGQITLDDNATQSGAQTLTVTYYNVITNGWFIDNLNNEVYPIVERVTRATYNGTSTVEEYYSGTGSSILVLNKRPVISIDNLSYTNVDSTLYYLTPTAMQLIGDEGIIKAKANFNESTYTPIFWKGERNLRVTYTYGYANCPNNVAQAMKYMMAESALGQIADTTGGGNLSVQAFSRDFGTRGRYTNIRNQLATRAYALLRQEMVGTIG